MNYINWYFYADTNAKADAIEDILIRNKQTLTYVQTLEDLYILLQQTPNAVLFLKTNTIYNVYELCQEVSVKYPYVYTIIITPDISENMKKAMNARASDLLRSTDTSEEIANVVNQALKYMNYRAKQADVPVLNVLNKESRIISICGPKGGIGRTFLTVNLAASFVKQGKKTAIIDACLQFGDLAMFFDLKPKQTIYEWVKEGYERGIYAIDHYMCKHESGVSILAAPPRPEFFEMIKEEHIEIVITEMKKFYDVILIDNSSYLSEIHLKSLILSDDILLLTLNDLPVLRSTKLYIDTLQTLKQSEKIKIILNRNARKKIIEDKRIEEILQRPIFTFLPNQEPAVAASINEGIPLVWNNAKLPLSKAILLLTQKLSFERDHVFAEGSKKKRRIQFHS